jgi:CarD family transcriptional regulator
VVRDERPIDGPAILPSLSRIVDLRGDRLAFAEGDKVVYPHHGAAVVESVIERESFGEIRTYLKLRLPHGLTIMVPIDSADQVGLRRVSGREDIDGVFDLLRQEESAMPPLWTQRLKINLAKIASGDIRQGAEVIRDLSLMARRARISDGDRRLLAKAREVLISELTFTFDSTEESAQAMLDGVLEESKVDLALA